MVHSSQNNQPEKKKRRPSTNRSGGVAPPRREDEGQRALGNQTDMGDQPAHNVTGDQPAKMPPGSHKRRDASVARSNSTADATSHSPYASKAGRMDTGGVASAGSDEPNEGPSNPMTSRDPRQSEK